MYRQKKVGKVAIIIVLVIAFSVTWKSTNAASSPTSPSSPVIVGKWKNTSGATDVYTFYPDGSATDQHQGILSHGSWIQASGVNYGKPYEFYCQWDFGPPKMAPFIDYIHIVDYSHYSLVNQYGNPHTAERIPDRIPFSRDNPTVDKLPTFPAPPIGDDEAFQQWRNEIINFLMYHSLTAEQREEIAKIVISADEQHHQILYQNLEGSVPTLNEDVLPSWFGFTDPFNDFVVGYHDVTAGLIR